MQCCKQCGVKFTYKELMKSGIMGYKPVTCRFCGAVHKVTFASRLSVAFVIAIPMFLLLILQIIPSEDVSFLQVLIIYLLLLCPFIFLIPYLLRYKPQGTSH